MLEKDKTLYDKIPVELLGGFYYEINLNIKKGVLSENMYHEIELIKRAVERRGLDLKELYRIGLKLTWENRIRSVNS